MRVFKFSLKILLLTIFIALLWYCCQFEKKAVIRSDECCQFEKKTAIRWDEFSISSMEGHLNDFRPVLILALPQFIKHLSDQAEAAFTNPLIEEHCIEQNYAMLRFYYRPWGQPDPDRQDEIQWVLDHTGYKEPSLVLVKKNGEIKTLKYILNKDQISDFLLNELVPKSCTTN